jgi:signal transduction histidine kinase
VREPPVSLGRRLDVPPTGDELARLAATFNAMLDRLQAAFLAQRRFVADASHELRTPLAAIRGNTDVLARQVVTLPDHPVRHDLLSAAEDMQRESRRMGRLLDDLLFLARSDADAAEGTARLECVPVRLDESRPRPSGLRRGWRTASRCGLETVPVTVRGDRDKLVQVALALLDNALRHTALGDPIVVVARSSDGWAELEVRDAGTGIREPPRAPHLRPFFRATPTGVAVREEQDWVWPSRKPSPPLTEATSRQSVLGQGSTFRLRLPGGSTAITATAPRRSPIADEPGLPRALGDPVAPERGAASRRQTEDDESSAARG